jgi:hypothetical protein
MNTEPPTGHSARGNMTDDINAYIDAASRLQGIAIEPEWKPNVARFLEIARNMARLVEETGALTDAEAAPVFTPRGSE